MKSILFVTELQVWPPQGGQNIHACTVIDSLSRCFAVSVLAPLPTSDCPLLRQVRSWHNLAVDPASFRRQVADSRFVLFRRRAWEQQLAQLLTELRPKIVWFNYGHWGHYADLVHRSGARAVMQTHNVQSRLSWQGLASRPLSRMHVFYASHALTETLHEWTYFRRFDRILSVSEIDRGAHARLVGQEHSLYVPNYLDESRYHLDPRPPRDPNLLVMTANFGAFQNCAGATWFVEQVWPAVKQSVPAARLELAGIAPSGWREKMQKTLGVRCTGRVSSVIPTLQQAAVAVAPLHHGSGTRFKILEALVCQTPLVSTKVGAEGIELVDGVHARIVDTPSAFAAAVVALLRDTAQGERLAADGLALLRAEYGFEVNTERLRQIVTTLGA